MRRRLIGLLRDYWVVLLAPFALLGPMLLRGQVIFWGTPVLQFVPWWVYAWESLSQGALPLWNPLNGMGAPLIANYQLAFFYSPNWLLLGFAALGGAPWVAWGFTLLAALHLAWAGLGMALLLKRLGFGWMGQVIGGLAFGLSGFIVARLGFYSMTWAAAWLPWIIYTTDQIASPVKPVGDEQEAADRSKFRLSLGLTACLAMLLLSGHAQLAWYSILLAGGWALFGGLREGGLRHLPKVIAEMGAAGLLAASLAAVQLVPTFEYLQNSYRADAFAYEEAMTYSFWPWRFISIFSPDFFGNPAAGDFWGYATYWEDHLYPGLLPMILVLATLLLVVKGFRSERRSRFWGLLLFGWGSMAVAFILAMGKNLVIFPFLYHHVPTFDMFQAPARYLLWTAFFLPILAAVGVDRWRCPTGKGLYWFRLATAGAFAIMLGSGLAWLVMEDIKLTFIRATALMGFWGLGFGLLTLVLPVAEKAGRRSWWQMAVVAWTLADLLFTGWGANLGTDMALFEGQSQASRQLVESGVQRVYLPLEDERVLKFERFFRFDNFLAVENWRDLREVILPNLNLLDGIALARNFDPLVSQRYAGWMALLDEMEPESQTPWLAMMGTGAVERIDESQPSGVRYDRVEGAERWRWYPCVTPVPDLATAREILKERMAKSQDPASQPPIVEGWDGSPPAGCEVDASSGSNQVTIDKIQERPDRLVLEVESAADGWLFIADTWYPGWQSSVDDVPTRIFPANTLFRAVFVPAGKYQVQLLYMPFGFYFSSLFSILVLLLILLFRFKRGRGLNRTQPL